jgi:hypothetical protein
MSNNTHANSQSLALSTESFFLLSHTRYLCPSLSLCPSGVKCSSLSLFAVLVELWIGKKANLFLLVTTTSIWKCQITNASTGPLWMIR